MIIDDEDHPGIASVALNSKEALPEGVVLQKSGNGVKLKVQLALLKLLMTP